MHKKLALAFVLLFLMLSCIPRMSPSDETGQNIDVHLHLWGNQGPGIMPGGPGQKGPKGNKSLGSGEKDYESAAKNLLEFMDKYGVKKALLMPPPRTRENTDLTEVQELLSVAKNHPDRFAVAAGGDVLNPVIHEIAASDVTDDVKKQFEAEAEKLVSYGIKAFGEMAALHLSMNQKHVVESASPDHPLFLLLADIATRHDIPIDLHMEAVPEDMPKPEGLNDKNPDTLKANIPAFERLLSHNLKVRIVWQHIGWDNTGNMTVALLRRLLKDHDNLFLALRVEDRPMMVGSRNPMPNRIVDENWKVKNEWLELFKEFPDRFVIGTDEFFGTPGTKSPQSFEETWRLMEQLPEGLAKKIGHDNAARIYGL